MRMRKKKKRCDIRNVTCMRVCKQYFYKEWSLFLTNLTVLDRSLSIMIRWRYLLKSILVKVVVILRKKKKEITHVQVLKNISIKLKEIYIKKISIRSLSQSVTFNHLLQFYWLVIFINFISFTRLLYLMKKKWILDPIMSNITISKSEDFTRILILIYWLKVIFSR